MDRRVGAGEREAFEVQYDRCGVIGKGRGHSCYPYGIGSHARVRGWPDPAVDDGDTLNPQRGKIWLVSVEQAVVDDEAARRVRDLAIECGPAGCGLDYRRRSNRAQERGENPLKPGGWSGHNPIIGGDMLFL